MSYSWDERCPACDGMFNHDKRGFWWCFCGYRELDNELTEEAKFMIWLNGK
jgi:hypothetical protein